MPIWRFLVSWFLGLWGTLLPDSLIPWFLDSLILWVLDSSIPWFLEEWNISRNCHPYFLLSTFFWWLYLSPTPKGWEIRTLSVLRAHLAGRAQNSSSVATSMLGLRRRKAVVHSRLAIYLHLFILRPLTAQQQVGSKQWSKINNPFWKFRYFRVF